MSESETEKPPISPYTWLLSRRPDFMSSFTHPIRQEAVQHLELKQGDRVLDVGCGTGTSFPYLVQAVGNSGEVVGVEISPAMVAEAGKRVANKGWNLAAKVWFSIRSSASSRANSCRHPLLP